METKENKIPCIKINQNQWKTIKPYLDKWGYVESDSFVEDFENFPLLVINSGGKIGVYNTLDLDSLCDYNRELVKDIDEFLIKIAQLKGHEYIKNDMKITPCIEINQEEWNIIKPYLDKWGYEPTDSFCEDFAYYPILMFNIDDNINDYTNVELNCPLLCDYNRKLINDVDEFLTLLAQLKGYKYKKENKENKEENVMENKENIIKINGIEIKPGMVICTEDNDILVVFPLINGLGVINYKQCSWQNIEYFINIYKNKIKVILDKSKGCSLDNGDVLWKKPKRVTLTKQQIADKFGIDIDLLDIKD